MRIRARNVLRKDPVGSFIVAPHDTDQAGIVGGKTIGARLQTIQKSSDSGIDKTLMGKASQNRRLPTARFGTAIRHIRRLVPVEYRARRVEVVNLQQAVFQFGKD